ncbi:MAG: hypothetical protein R3F61_15950 [Myxococcota bacterium]
MLVLTLCSGCLWKGEGMVRSAAVGATLETPTGQRFRLVYGEEDRMLAHLDGHIVTMEGRRVGRNLKVGEWHIPWGLHGMNVWFGQLERKGAQLGLQDQNSGAYYLLARESEEALVPYVGSNVLIEGYVAGSHVVEVLHWQVLEKQGASDQ